MIAYATDSHCNRIASLLFRCVYTCSLVTQPQDIRSAQPEEETSTSEDDADGAFYDSDEHCTTSKASATRWQVMESNVEGSLHEWISAPRADGEEPYLCGAAAGRAGRCFPSKRGLACLRFVGELLQEI